MEPDSLGSGAETSGLGHLGDQIQALNTRSPSQEQARGRHRKPFPWQQLFELRQRVQRRGKGGINYHNRSGFKQPCRGNCGRSQLSGASPSRLLTWRAVRAPSIAAPSCARHPARASLRAPGREGGAARARRALPAPALGISTSRSARALCVLWRQLVTIVFG